MNKYNKFNGSRNDNVHLAQDRTLGRIARGLKDVVSALTPSNIITKEDLTNYKLYDSYNYENDYTAVPTNEHWEHEQLAGVTTIVTDIGESNGSGLRVRDQDANAHYFVYSRYIMPRNLSYYTSWAIKNHTSINTSMRAYFGYLDTLGNRVNTTPIRTDRVRGAYWELNSDNQTEPLSIFNVYWESTSVDIFQSFTMSQFNVDKLDGTGPSKINLVGNIVDRQLTLYLEHTDGHFKFYISDDKGQIFLVHDILDGRTFNSNYNPRASHRSFTSVTSLNAWSNIPEVFSVQQVKIYVANEESVGRSWSHRVQTVVPLTSLGQVNLLQLNIMQNATNVPNMGYATTIPSTLEYIIDVGTDHVLRIYYIYNVQAETLVGTSTATVGCLDFIEIANTTPANWSLLREHVMSGNENKYVVDLDGIDWEKYIKQQSYDAIVNVRNTSGLAFEIENLEATTPNVTICSLNWNEM